MTNIRPSEPTQVRFPIKAILRTIVQVGIPTLLTLCVIIPLIVQAILDNFGEVLPPQFTAWMLGVSAFVTALAATIARVMAIPAVNAWLTHLGLGATPKLPTG